MSIRNQLLQDILSAIGGGGSVLWGSITGTIADQTDLAEVAKTNDYNDLSNQPLLLDNRIIVTQASQLSGLLDTCSTFGPNPWF